MKLKEADRKRMADLIRKHREEAAKRAKLKELMAESVRTHGSADGVIKW